MQRHNATLLDIAKAAQLTQPPFDHIQTLDATPDNTLIDAYNRHVAHNNHAYHLNIQQAQLNSSTKRNQM